MNKFAFEIYRPQKSSNRVEDYIQKRGGWAPSQKYDYKLWDIQNQFTPSEAYRHRMQTSGAHIRLMQRLEWRWQKDYENWWKCALIVQSGYRGMLGRRYFASIKVKLRQEREQRLTMVAVVEHFKEGQYDLALEKLAQCEVLTSELHTINCKIMYLSRRFDPCKKACKKLMKDYPAVEAGYYIFGCCLSRERKYQEVYMLLKELMSAVDVPSANAYQLCGFICAKLDAPPLYECCFAMDAQYVTQPHDMEALLLRATAASMAQDWDTAIKDYTTILYYQPYLTHVLCLRARAYTCTRKWDLAKEDYELVLSWYPEDETAWYGLQDMSQPYDELPMIDHNLVNDAV
jgi:tetratricopeptide (TPR) repeat protein